MQAETTTSAVAVEIAATTLIVVADAGAIGAVETLTGTAAATTAGMGREDADGETSAMAARRVRIGTNRDRAGGEATIGIAAEEEAVVVATMDGTIGHCRSDCANWPGQTLASATMATTSRGRDSSNSLVGGTLEVVAI
uniref:(northern house mosquito) hypothetical protein n=1 Tax=Culex pipiens TaxID=7175 RepID=A0A8D8LA50_CULPI